MRMVISLMMLISVAVDCSAYFPPQPFPGAPGSANTTAMHMSTNAFVAWASGYTNVVYGDGVSEMWKTPDKALGHAVGDAFDIISLGRGGSITLSFPRGISDGEGFDFAVFENAISDSFLELGWVEVSSDGVTFVRFPNFSLTTAPVGPFGSLDPTFIHGYGGKYRQGYGTPFDLSELHLVYHSILAGTDHFSAAFENAFLSAYVSLDFDNIQFVRVVDVIGDGFDYDSEGYAIYDPYETFDSVGFDLDAVGVIHEAGSVPSGLPSLSIVSVDAFVTLAYAYDFTVFTNETIEQSDDLFLWSNAVPEVISRSTNGNMLQCMVQFEIDATNRFYRLRFNEQ